VCVGLRAPCCMAPNMPSNLLFRLASIMRDQQQHTVSRFYLKQFTPETGDKILWQYGRDGTGPTRVSPRHATAEIHFYSVQQADGAWDNSLEKALAEVEQKTAPAIKRLTSGDTLFRGDRETIAYFIGLLLFRVSAIAEHANAENARLQTVDGAIQFLRGDRKYLERLFSKAEVYAFEQEIRDRGIGVTPIAKHHLLMLATSAPKAARTIFEMQWNVCRTCTGSYFITSDRPAFTRRPHRLLDPYPVGFQRDDLGAELGFPLSRDAYLLATWKPLPRSHTGTINRQRVRELNRRTVLSATKYVFAPEPSREISALIAEHRGFRVGYPSLLDATPYSRQRARRLRHPTAATS
jgi:hypothetical protein